MAGHSTIVNLGGDLLLHFHHADIAFVPVVVEQDVEVLHEGDSFPPVMVGNFISEPLFL